MNSEFEFEIIAPYKFYSQEIRELYLTKIVKSYAKEVFELLPELNSIAFCVAQYWNDSADDEILIECIYSVLSTPDYEDQNIINNWESADHEGNYLPFKLSTNLPFIHDRDHYFKYFSKIPNRYCSDFAEYWPDEEKKINTDYVLSTLHTSCAVFACYALEYGANFYDLWTERYGLCCTFRKVLTPTDELTITHEIHPMARPWLEGVGGRQRNNEDPYPENDPDSEMSLLNALEILRKLA